MNGSVRRNHLSHWRAPSFITHLPLIRLQSRVLSAQFKLIPERVCLLNWMKQRPCRKTVHDHAIKDCIVLHPHKWSQFNKQPGSSLAFLKAWKFGFGILRLTLFRVYSSINACSTALSSCKGHPCGGRGFFDHTSSCHTAGVVWSTWLNFTNRMCVCPHFPLHFWLCYPKGQSALLNLMKTSPHLGSNVFTFTACNTDKKTEVYSI